MLPGAHIRIADTRDAPRLAVLATQVWLHTYATEGISPGIADYVLAELTPTNFLSKLQSASTRVLVAAQGEHLRGFAIIQHGVPAPVASCHSSVELQTLYVQAQCVGQGLGAALLHASEAWAREQANAPLWLSVYAHNPKAIGFYHRQRYTQIGTTHFALGSALHENYVLQGSTRPHPTLV